MNFYIKRYGINRKTAPHKRQNARSPGFEPGASRLDRVHVAI